jgi:uncharacterized HAD superfamily protein
LRLRLNKDRTIKYRANKTLIVTSEKIRLKEIMKSLEDFREFHNFQKLTVRVKLVKFFTNNHLYTFRYRLSTKALTLVQIDNKMLGVRTEAEQDSLLELLYFTFPCVCKKVYREVILCKMGR